VQVVALLRFRRFRFQFGFEDTIQWGGDDSPLTESGKPSHGGRTDEDEVHESAAVRVKGEVASDLLSSLPHPTRECLKALTTPYPIECVRIDEGRLHGPKFLNQSSVVLTG
jgi:hypothetical protein